MCALRYREKLAVTTWTGGRPAGLAIPAPVLAELDEHGLAVSATLEAVERRLTEQVTSS